MCTVCGCAGDGATIEGGAAGRGVHQHHHGHHHHGHHHGRHDRGHHHRDDGHHCHDHGDGHHHHHHHDNDDGAIDYGAGPARAHAPGLSQARMVEIETGILSKNDAFAAENRRRFAETGTLALNLVSSPGSGKTTLLVATVAALGSDVPVAVIEGDQQTSNDAERIRATGAPAVQVNTGKGCHLDAHMVGHALDRLAGEPFGVVFIENVGNLVCPAAFDLGEEAKVAILSVTEGEDKPLKYPDMFTAASLVIVNKTDLAEPCGVDLSLIEANARRVNPAVEILRLSARTGEGMDGWLAWLAARRRAVIARAGGEPRAHAAAE